MKQQVEEQKKLNGLIKTLPSEEVDKVISYAAFLKYSIEKETSEDLQVIEDRRCEPSTTWEKVKKDLKI